MCFTWDQTKRQSNLNKHLPMPDTSDEAPALTQRDFDSARFRVAGREVSRADWQAAVRAGDGRAAAAIRDVTARVVASLAPERILLFGSYAWGTPDADSDLDLYVIVPDQPEPGYRLARRGYLALRGVGIPVDLVVRSHSESARNAGLVATLDHSVLTHGIPLYG